MQSRQSSRSLTSSSLQNKPLTEKELASFGKENKPFNCPFVLKIEDLNNKNAKDIQDCNPEKRAVFVGIRIPF